MQISFQSTIKELTEDLRKIKASAVPKAATQGLNRTAIGTKTDAVREISKVTGVKVTETRNRIEGPADKHKYKATKTRLVAQVNASEGRAQNLINFVTPGARKPNHFNKLTISKRGKRKYKSKGVKAKAWGNRKYYRGTFIGKGKDSNAYLVFARTSSKRKPLKPIHGPSIRSTFNSSTMQAKLKSMAAVRFQKNMAAAVRNQIRLATKGSIAPKG